MTARVRVLRRAAALQDRCRAALDDLIPGTVRSHLRNARREVLLALRELLDEALARAEKPARPRRPRRVRVR